MAEGISEVLAPPKWEQRIKQRYMDLYTKYLWTKKLSHDEEIEFKALHLQILRLVQI